MRLMPPKGSKDQANLKMSRISVGYMQNRYQAQLNPRCIRRNQVMQQPYTTVAIKSKISVSYDNATLHTDFCKQDASATSCKILQTLYLCLNIQFKHTKTYEYI